MRAVKTLLLTVGILALAGPATGSPIGTWSGHAESVERWIAADPELAEQFFGPGIRYWTAEQPVGTGNAISVYTVDGFERRARRLDPGTIVMYNPEAEPVTPRFEQRHPRWMMRQFVRTAHAYGLFAVLAPSRTLAKPDPKCAVFAKCGYLEIAADAFHLQAQRLECDLPTFEAFVQAARARVRSPLVIQLTVGWTDPCVTPQTVRDAYLAALPYADGFALWGHGDPERNAMGLDVLRLILGTR